MTGCMRSVPKGDLSDGPRMRRSRASGGVAYPALRATPSRRSARGGGSRVRSVHSDLARCPCHPGAGGRPPMKLPIISEWPVARQLASGDRSGPGGESERPDPGARAAHRHRRPRREVRVPVLRGGLRPARLREGRAHRRHRGRSRLTDLAGLPLSQGRRDVPARDRIAAQAPRPPPTVGGEAWERIPLEQAMDMVAERVKRTRDATFQERIDDRGAPRRPRAALARRRPPRRRAAPRTADRLGRSRDARNARAPVRASPRGAPPPGIPTPTFSMQRAGRGAAGLATRGRPPDGCPRPAGSTRRARSRSNMERFPDPRPRGRQARRAAARAPRAGSSMRRAGSSSTCASR